MRHIFCLLQLARALRPIGCVCACAAAMFVQASAATLSGATGAHDPSRMVFCNGKYYVYATGGGMKSSPDGIHWTAGPSPFPAAVAAAAPSPEMEGRSARRDLPASLKAVLPEHQGIWAPDAIFYRGRYLLYYSACGPHGVERCGIGLLTSPTLDPTAPDYRWTDAGVVIVTENMVEKKAAIDPGPFVDATGGLWLSWGSGYGNGNGPTDPTIVISKLDDATGLRSTTDTTMYPVAPGHIEAAYVHYRAGFYYAFWNDGGCCGGVTSTYRIHVARSASPQGPYVSRSGKPGAGDIFMASVKEQQVYGPGHIGIESEPGLDRFSFHYYNAEGRPVLGVRTLVWDVDEWPSVGQDLQPGTYTIQASSGLVLGERHGAGPTPGVELRRPDGTDLQRWRVTMTPDGYYRLTSVGDGKSLAPVTRSTTSKASTSVEAGAASDTPWIVELASDGVTYRVRSPASLETLTVPTTAAGKGRGAVAPISAPWSGLPTQRWLFAAP